MKKNRFVGIILAAGLSSRMGNPKPLLQLGGKPAIIKLIDSFYDAGVSKVFAVTGHNREMMEPFIRNAEAVYNPDYNDGMITSIKSGLSAALKYDDWDGALFTPVDHALIRPYTIKLLINEFQPGMESVIFPAFNGRRGHPPLLSRGMAGKLCDMDGPWGAKRFLFSQGDAIRDVEVGSDDMFADMDTPEDYETMKRLCAREAPTALECECMLRAERTPEKVVKHCRAVAEKALIIVDDAICAGYKIDKSIVFAAAMLHDICRTDQDHARAGAAVLDENGFPLVADVIADHMDIPDHKVENIEEASIVYLADKMTDGVADCTIEARISALPPDKREFGEARLKKAIKIRDRIYK